MMTGECESEVQRRLEEIRSDPEELMRYDRNGDGVIDDEEWAEVRRVVEAEVLTSQRRRARQQRESGEAEALETLVDRYELLREIGRGGQGRTLLARDLQAERKVAVKELSMKRIDSWKAVELFEREGRTLASIDHQGIPDYIDAFHLESADGLRERFFLVQEYVDGESFEELLEEGLRLTEEEACELVREVLEILDYLHGMDPPVIHRDLKPSNLMRRRDGRLALIDFGAVQTLVAESEAGATVVGTSGYMPLEQLTGRAVAASDLYALGATMVHLLSHRHPADLPMEYMRLRFHKYVHLSAPFVAFLDQLLEPHATKRFSSAKEAKEALKQVEALAQAGASLTEMAVTSQAELTRRRSMAPTILLGAMLGLLTPCWGLFSFLGVADRFNDGTLRLIVMALNLVWFGIFFALVTTEVSRRKGRSR